MCQSEEVVNCPIRNRKRVHQEYGQYLIGSSKPASKYGQYSIGSSKPASKYGHYSIGSSKPAS